MTSTELDKTKWRPELDIDSYIERLLWDVYFKGQEDARGLSGSNRKLLEAKHNVKQLISDVVEGLLPEKTVARDENHLYWLQNLDKEKAYEAHNRVLDTIRNNKAKLLGAERINR